jgi:hypothetical protein
MKEDEIGEACSTHGRDNACKVLVGKPKGKTPLGRSRRRWEDDVEMDFIETGCEGVDWIQLAQDRDRWSCSEHSNES